jgi:hypothetical protein
LQAADKSGKTALQWAYSRLSRIRHSFQNLEITQIQDEIQQIIELLSSYMNASDANAIKTKVKKIQTVEDIDELQAMLEGMSL